MSKSCPNGGRIGNGKVGETDRGAKLMLGMARLLLGYKDFTWELFNDANVANVVLNVVLNGDGPTISWSYGFHMRAI